MVCYKVCLPNIIPDTLLIVAADDGDLRSLMTDLFLIRIFGDGGAPVTQKVSSILADMDADILDIGHSVIHDNLSLGILVYLPSSNRSIPGELEDRLGSIAEKILISSVSLDSYEVWVQNQGAPRYVLTLLARKLKASHLSVVSDLIARSDLKVDAIKRLSGRISRKSESNSTKACVEFSIRGEPQKSFRESLLAVGNEFQIDIALQEDGIYRRHRRLIAFDMDSTLIATEVIDELADRFNVGEQVKTITAQAMAGELDFADSLRRRVGLLKGMSSVDLQHVAAKIPLAEGAESLFKTLNHLGYKTAIISGGFSFFGNQLKEKLGIRLENDILITENGNKDLMGSAPIEIEEMYNIKLKPLDDICNQDAIIIAVAHDSYRAFEESDWIKMFNHMGVLIDVKSLYDKNTFDKSQIRHWRL